MPIGLLLWAAGAAVLAIHSTGLGLPDPTRFAMLDSWLVGLACLGCPLMALRAFTQRIRLQAFAAVAVFCLALAVLLTVLILGGAMHPDTLNGTFEVILPLAAFIQAANAYDSEVHARRREAVAEQAARTDALAERLEAHYRAVANLDRLDAMGVGELGMLIEVASGLRNAKLCEHGPLRLVPAPATANGHRRDRARTGPT